MTERAIEPSIGSPFKVEKHPDEVGWAIVTVAEFCNQPRTAVQEQFLESLVKSHYTRIAVDLSKTIMMTTTWFRIWARLTAQAKTMGKLVGLVGLSPTLKRTSDFIGVSKVLEVFERIDEVWKR